METTTDRLVGKGRAVGKTAPDFRLTDQNGGEFHFYDEIGKGPHLLVFYPSDFTAVCTKQLCDYRDHLQDFKAFGVHVVGISKNPTASHERFAKENRFSFPLLSDPDHSVASAYGCRSLLMFGGVSRAIAIVSTQKVILYHYVESTAITRRKSDELLKVLTDLRESGQI